MRKSTEMYDGTSLMQYHATVLKVTNANVLEVGFGHGMFTKCALAYQPKSYTIVDDDELAITDARTLFSKLSTISPNIVHGRWQDKIESLPISFFDAIMYDIDENSGNPLLDLCEFAANHAKRLLKSGGRFSFRYADWSLDRRIFDALFSWAEIHTIDRIEIDPPIIDAKASGKRLVICARKK